MILRTQSKPVYDFGLAMGLSIPASLILSIRTNNKDDASNIINSSRGDYVIPPTSLLKGAILAAKKIYKHIEDDSHIVFNTDYDADGTSALGLGLVALTQYFNVHRSKIFVIQNERVYGNGFNKHSLDLVLKEDAKRTFGLMITADHGSADEDRYSKLPKSIDIVVTDHHKLPKSGVPKTPKVFVNPQQPGDKYSPHISGSTVLYLILKEVYKLHIVNGRPLGKTDGMRSILPHATNTIVTDQMNLSDPINRQLLVQGLDILNTERLGPWDELFKSIGITGKIDVTTIGFKIGPVLNGAGRMGRAEAVHKFLMRTNLQSAGPEADLLVQLNMDRKQLEANITSGIGSQTEQYIKKYNHTICVLALDGHGVGGILASRLGEKYRRPTFVFDKDISGNYVSSGRSIIPEVSMDVTIKEISKQYTGIIIKGGGHDAAGGCEVHAGKLNEFFDAFDKIVSDQTNGKTIPINELIDNTPYDLELPIDKINMGLHTAFNDIAPFGNGFPDPTILSRGYINKIRFVGKNKEYTIIELSTGNGNSIKGFYPYNDDSSKRLRYGDMVKVIFTISSKSSDEVEMSVKRIKKI